MAIPEDPFYTGRPIFSIFHLESEKEETIRNGEDPFPPLWKQELHLGIDRLVDEKLQDVGYFSLEEYRIKQMKKF